MCQRPSGDLLNVVAELQDELERFKSTRDQEGEIDYWNQDLTYLRQGQPLEIIKDEES